MSDTQQSSGSRKPSSTNTSDSKLATDPPMLNLEEAEEDRKHMQKIIAALRYYQKYCYARVNKTESYLNSLPKRHQDMLVKYRNHLRVIRDCIDENQKVIKKMLRDNVGFMDMGGSEYLAQQDSDGHTTKIRHQDMEHATEQADVEPFKILKAQSTLKLIARDWSAACAEEREQSYKPIIDAVEEFFKPGEFALNEVKILVPGAGLGRLTYELACRGYECEGNEFSYFMLIASYFVLNLCTEENKYTLYPWVHQYVNNLRMADQVAPIRFPDICPAKNPPKGNIMIAAGDFLEVYKTPNCYDCVATCFFIDCGNNIVDFIEAIFRILKPGGIWVNLGPLLYHFSDIQGENSIEPTFENLELIIKMVGFEFLRSQTGVRTKYAQNPQSMLKSEYESLFWVCRKPENARDNTDDLSQRDDDVEESGGSSTSNPNNHYVDIYSNGYKNAYQHQ
ncbi:carnosine N-methyltransferase isoform X1 [Bactrocera neohumeralis]|uniref:carnosine N-methyltransferase isoform X1 n=1 Tax=Bactrocera tryoni TaxID=59916 RepID=UPI001A97F281|nr:carnosine N-methyltransferase isoform X1 [Bactrocera tryoni]XP_039958817.1 carnosine N-methyltransferase isoform X1 [Bactrocera tryoni]XP_050328291.1 carnosine N-methyltransferase isoform X1 [Bactrocera neohumeralis]